MIRHLVLLSTVALVGVAAAPFRADAAEPEPPAVERHHELRIDGGFASAIGSLGVTWTSDLGRVLRLEAGVGVGLSGFQFSAMPKLAFGEGPSRFQIGLGPALAVIPEEEPALWLNADLVGWSWRTESGMAFSVGAGVALCLADDRHRDDLRTGLVFPQFRAGGGWAF